MAAIAAPASAAYGQAQSVKNAGVNYVTNVLYHENGAIESANYLNGHQLSQIPASFYPFLERQFLRRHRLSAPSRGR